MKLTRRQFVLSSIPVVVAGTLSVPELVHAKLARGGGGSLVSGFYPLTHSMQPLGINMRQVFPRPDSETNTYAAHHFVYWDGTTGLQYRRRIGVSFGRFPYVYQLMSGPPGMTIGATVWNPAWNCGGRAAAQAGYGVVYWTPTTGNVSGGPWLVWVRVYDQNNQGGTSSYVDVQWTLYVAGSYVNTTITFTSSLSSGATSAALSSAWSGYTGGVSVAFSDGETRICNVTNGSTAVTWSTALTANVTSSATATGGHIFADSTNGNDSNSGTLTSPLKTIQGTHGALYATIKNPQAICILRGSPTTTVQYVPPAYSDNTNSGILGPNVFEWSATNKPCAVLVYPGETATWDWTGSQNTGTGYPYQSAWTSIGAGNDAFFQDFVLNGYINDGATGDARGFDFNFSRVTFDSLSWTNSGYGFNANNNATFFFLNNNGEVPTPEYCFVTGCLDSGRQSGAPGNNYGLASAYGFEDVLWEFNELHAPSNSMDGAVYFKDGVQYGCQRGNLTNIASSSHIHSMGQSYNIHPEANNEFCFNTVISTGDTSLKWLDGAPPYTVGSCTAYRNNLTDGVLVIEPAQRPTNLMGPTISSATPSTGSGSLAAGTYFYRGTTLGVTGESVGGDGQGNNEHSATLSATGKITLALIPAPDGSGIRIYRGTSSGGENQYTSVSNTTTFVDDGTLTWTSATIPASATSLSADRLSSGSNAFQTSSSGPTGAVYQALGNDQIAASGLVLSTASGGSPAGGLNPAYPSYASIYGLVGAEIA